MLKVGFVTNYIVRNGPGNVILNLISNLDDARYEISLITLFEGNDTYVVKNLRNKGVRVYECVTLNRTMCILSRAAEFEEIVQRENFDVIHSHGFIGDILSSRLNLPVKRITTIHNNMYEDYLDTYGYAKSRIFIALHMAALKKLDECVCCSKSVYDVMKQHLPNVSFIRNGIEPTHAHSVVTRAEVNVPEDARVFLYAGVLNSRKNIVWLIENFVQCHENDEYLLVLGSGEKEAECKAKADDHIRMLGFQTDPIAYMNISDVYVSASKSEGFSISVLEALSCGLGLLLSDIPSHREVVEMGQDVYLGEVFSLDNFKFKLDAVRKKKIDKAEISAFQENELSAKEMTKQYENFYIS